MPHRGEKVQNVSVRTAVYNFLGKDIRRQIIHLRVLIVDEWLRSLGSTSGVSIVNKASLGINKLVYFLFSITQEIKKTPSEWY